MSALCHASAPLLDLSEPFGLSPDSWHLEAAPPLTPLPANDRIMQSIAAMMNAEDSDHSDHLSWGISGEDEGHDRRKACNQEVNKSAIGKKLMADAILGSKESHTKVKGLLAIKGKNKKGYHHSELPPPEVEYLCQNWRDLGKWEKYKDPQWRANEKEKEEKRRNWALKFMASLPVNERPSDLPQRVVEEPLLPQTVVEEPFSSLSAPEQLDVQSMELMQIKESSAVDCNDGESVVSIPTAEELQKM